jgi:ribonucleoside-diphosphate reductase alpha chain
MEVRASTRKWWKNLSKNKKDRLYEIVSYFLSYPDIFFSYYQTDKSKYRPWVYDDARLRGAIRYGDAYLEECRGTGKSIMVNGRIVLFLQIFYPGSRGIEITSTKESGIPILKSALQNTLNQYPDLNKEINGNVKYEKNSVEMAMKNGSSLSLKYPESGRGDNTTFQIREEYSDDKFNYSADNSNHIPTLREFPMIDGKRNPYIDRLWNIMISNAGNARRKWFEDFKKCAEAAVEGEAFVCAMNYLFLILSGRQTEKFINDYRKNNPSFLFMREYRNIPIGTIENPLIREEIIQKSRTIELTELMANEEDIKNGCKYVVTCDLAFESETVNRTFLFVLKCIPIIDDGIKRYEKQCVFAKLFPGWNSTVQGRIIKRLIREYRASALVLDVNGGGKAVLEAMKTDLKDGEPCYCLINPSISNLDGIVSYDAIPLIFGIKSQSAQTKNSDIIREFLVESGRGRIKYLINPINGREKYKRLNRIKDDTMDMEIESPYLATEEALSQFRNLQLKGEDAEIKVVRAVQNIPKDAFSALSYGIFYITKYMEVELRSDKIEREYSEEIIQKILKENPQISATKVGIIKKRRFFW